MCKKTALCGLSTHVAVGTLFWPDQQYFLVSFSLRKLFGSLCASGLGHRNKTVALGSHSHLVRPYE